uniref:Heat shock protein 70 n=1 Tax=Eutreptiella gymnastica TaxID=73025 RepID=A0A7S1J2M0_9EUGL
MSVVKHGAASAVDIVLNEQTKRKTITYLGFRGDERYFGEDANQLHTRFPVSMITYLTHWAGVKYDDAQKSQEQLMFRFNFVRTERDTVEVQVTKDTKYTAEELLAMLLTYVKSLTESFAEMPITDCVIAIPATYTLRQRQALEDAADIAGLKIYSFMHHSVAAALQYGISRRGFSELTNVVVFDMGAAKTEVGVFTFHPKDVNASKDNLGHMEVRSIKNDLNGGRHFDAMIARQIAAEFKEKSGTDVLTLTDSDALKAVAKLMRTSERVKEVLSANQAAPAPVEGIYAERDFNTVIKRDQFLELVQPLVDRAMETVRAAVADAGLTPEDIHVCELMGGGSRVPVVQERLTEYFGKPLSKTLNTDEAIALGTAFQAAKQSGLFRVKTFTIGERTQNNITFQLSATEAVPSPAMRPLFVAKESENSKIVTTYRQQDYNITMYQQSADGSYEAIDIFEMSDVNALYEKRGLFKDDVHPNSTTSVEARFSLANSGLITCNGATARFNNVVNTTKKVKRKEAPKADGAATPAADVPEGEEAAEEATEEESASEGSKAEPEVKADTDGVAEEVTEETTEEGAAKADSDADSPPADGDAATEDPKVKAEAEATPKEEDLYETVNTTQTLKHKDTVTVVVHHVLTPLPLTLEQVAAAKTTLWKLKEKDDHKRRISEAKNNLETSIYNTKYDKFFDLEELKPFYNASEEEAIRAQLTAVEEWLEEDGYDASAEDYTAKLKSITDLTDPVIAKFEKSKKKKATKKKVKDDDDNDDEDSDKKDKKDKKKKKKKVEKDDDDSDDKKQETNDANDEL